MAVMDKAQVEKLMDAIAARATALRDGQRNANLVPTNGSLWNIVDAFGNAEIESALEPAADAADIALRDETTFLQSQVAPILGPLIKAVNSAIATDGEYASLDALLTGEGAQVSPFINVLAASADGLGADLTPANVFSPSIQSVSPDKVYAGAEDNTIVDVTANITNVANANTTLFGADNSVLYVGFNRKPSTAKVHLFVDVVTPASADVVLEQQYWNGVEWVDLTTSDAATTGDYANVGTKGFTQGGVIEFDTPADWDAGWVTPTGAPISGTVSPDLTPRYWLRFARTANTIVTSPIVNVIRSGIGMGLAIITGVNQVRFIAGAAVASFYDAPDTIKLRAVLPIGDDVTPTITYKNRAGDSVSETQGAWTAPATGDVTAALTLHTANEGVAQVTDVEVVTAATGGMFIVESTQPRTPVL